MSAKLSFEYIMRYSLRFEQLFKFWSASSGTHTSLHFPKPGETIQPPKKPRICRASLSSNLSNLCPPQKCSLVAACPAGTQWKSPIARVFFATITPNLKTNFHISHDIWINDKDWQVLSFWDVYPNASTIIPVMDLHLMKSMQCPCNIPSWNIQPF